MEERISRRRVDETGSWGRTGRASYSSEESK